MVKLISMDFKYPSLRVILPVIGGTVRGPKVNGEILPFGADWLLIRPDGLFELDVRVTIRTDDGELVYLYYRGVSNASAEIRERIQKGEEVDPSEYYFRTTPIFETGSEKYKWLNQIICVGVGETEVKRVRYKIYQIL
ncbi:MAG: DUF3237 domain-containing protein [Deltaproteobacteria bacterium]|nr:DUF3237 domain-containing protein [Deltaproteobacteria bacterium]